MNRIASGASLARLLAAFSLATVCVAGVSGCGDDEAPKLGSQAAAAGAPAVKDSDGDGITDNIDRDNGNDGYADQPEPKPDQVVEPSELRKQTMKLVTESTQPAPGVRVVRLAVGGTLYIPLTQISVACEAYRAVYVSHSTVVAYEYGVTYTDVICREGKGR